MLSSQSLSIFVLNKRLCFSNYSFRLILSNATPAAESQISSLGILSYFSFLFSIIKEIQPIIWRFIKLFLKPFSFPLRLIHSFYLSDICNCLLKKLIYIADMFIDNINMNQNGQEAPHRGRDVTIAFGSFKKAAKNLSETMLNEEQDLDVPFIILQSFSLQSSSLRQAILTQASTKNLPTAIFQKFVMLLQEVSQTIKRLSKLEPKNRDIEKMISPIRRKYIENIALVQDAFQKILLDEKRIQSMTSKPELQYLKLIGRSNIIGPTHKLCAVNLQKTMKILAFLVQKEDIYRYEFYKLGDYSKLISHWGKLCNQQYESKHAVFNLINIMLPICTQELFQVKQFTQYIEFLIFVLSTEDVPYERQICQIIIKAAKSGDERIHRKIHFLIVEFSVKLQKLHVIFNAIFASIFTLNRARIDLSKQEKQYQDYKSKLPTFRQGQQQEIRIQTFTNIFQACEDIILQLKITSCIKGIVMNLLNKVMKLKPDEDNWALKSVLMIIDKWKPLIPIIILQTTFLTWILQFQTFSVQKYRILETLLKDSIIFPKQYNTYKFITLGDYVAAKLAAYLISSLHKEVYSLNDHTLLACCYLSRIQKFRSTCLRNYSQSDKRSVYSHFHKIFNEEKRNPGFFTIDSQKYKLISQNFFQILNQAKYQSESKQADQWQEAFTLEEISKSIQQGYNMKYFPQPDFAQLRSPISINLKGYLTYDVQWEQQENYGDSNQTMTLQDIYMNI